MFRKIYYHSLPSTNTYLKQNYEQYDDYTVIICYNQTSGHGRLARTWEMEPGNNIAMSILLKPKCEQGITNLSLLTSAAVFLALQKYAPMQIKWPNDILLNGKKVCGILLESIYNKKYSAVIVGIGINVNNIHFSQNLINKATSLKKELNKDFNIDIIINDVLDNFHTLYQNFQQNDNSYLEVCRNNSAIIGKNVYINDRKVEVINLLNNGNLLIEDGGKYEEIAFGEVTLERNY